MALCIAYNKQPDFSQVSPHASSTYNEIHIISQADVQKFRHEISQELRSHKLL